MFIHRAYCTGSVAKEIKSLQIISLAITIHCEYLLFRAIEYRFPMCIIFHSEIYSKNPFNVLVFSSSSYMCVCALVSWSCFKEHTQKMDDKEHVFTVDIISNRTKFSHDSLALFMCFFSLFFSVHICVCGNLNFYFSRLEWSVCNRLENADDLYVSSLQYICCSGKQYTCVLHARSSSPSLFIRTVQPDIVSNHKICINEVCVCV